MVSTGVFTLVMIVSPFLLLLCAFPFSISMYNRRGPVLSLWEARPHRKLQPQSETPDPRPTESGDAQYQPGATETARPKAVGVLANIREDERIIDELFASHKCKHFYFDVGTNIGVQIRKLYEPRRYPEAAFGPLFDEAFGNSSRCQVCALGIEPNDRHKQRLDQLESSLRRAGAGVMILHAAAAPMDGIINFDDRHSLKGEQDHEYYGARVNFEGTYTRAVSLPRLVKYIEGKLRKTKKDAQGKIIPAAFGKSRHRAWTGGQYPGPEKNKGSQIASRTEV